MNNISTSTGRSKGWWIPLAVFFIIVFTISWYCFLGAEDLLHCQSHTIKEAFYQASASYHHTNARIGEMLFYFLGMASDGTGSHPVFCFYRIIHPLILTAIPLLAYRLGTGCWPHKNAASGAVIVILCLTVLASRSDYFWLDGAFSWTYPSVLCMLYILLLEPTFSGDFRLSWRRWLCLLLLTPLMGMANETVPLISSAALFLPTVYWGIIKKQGFSGKHLTLFAVFLLFAAVFYLAPGPKERALEADWDFSFHTILWKSLFSSMWINFLYFTYLRPILIFAAIILLFRVKKLPVMNGRMWACVAAFLILWLPLLAAPSWGAPRSYYPLDMVILTMLASLLSRLLPELTRGGKVLLFGWVVPVYATMMIPMFALSYVRYALYTDLQEKAAAVKQAGQDTLIVRESELCIPTLIPGIPYVPNSIFQQQVTTKERPFMLIHEKEWADSPTFARIHHEVFPYRRKLPPKIPTRFGDEQLNKGFARTLGLKHVIYIAPDDEEKS